MANQEKNQRKQSKKTTIIQDKILNIIKKCFGISPHVYSKLKKGDSGSFLKYDKQPRNENMSTIMKLRDSWNNQQQQKRMPYPRKEKLIRKEF